MLARKEQAQAEAMVKVELGNLQDLDMGMHPTTNIKPSSKNRRRFSDEQIKSLEFMFESDSRPESLIKQQLANELGLHPRQIAIWFQNRRARSKAKQIERDYNILKESYDALASGYDSLKRENQSLHIRLQKLKSQLEMEHGDKTYEPNRTAGSSCDGKSDNRNAIFDANDKMVFPFEGCDHMLSSYNNCRNIVESKDEDRVALEVMEATDGSLNSSEKWCSFESNTFLDESSCSSNWWEYW
ncbi:hypothetical protein DITRI_Ditri07aG0113900 [Diplodiscus trichospermus]